MSAPKFLALATLPWISASLACALPQPEQSSTNSANPTAAPQTAESPATSGSPAQSPSPADDSAPQPAIVGDATPPPASPSCDDEQPQVNPLQGEALPSPENQWGMLDQPRQPSQSGQPAPGIPEGIAPLKPAPQPSANPTPPATPPPAADKLPAGWDNNIATLKVLSPGVRDGGVIKLPQRDGNCPVWWFSPVLLNNAPDGWFVRTAPEAGLQPMRVLLQNGREQILNVPLYVLDVEREGGAFALSQPGFSPDSGYDQSGTIGGALHTSLSRMRQDSQKINAALNQLDQLLKALPDSEAAESPAPAPANQP